MKHDTEIERYRFDDAFEKVLEYDKSARAYIFIGKYINYGITAKMHESTKIRKVAVHNEENYVNNQG